MFDLKKKSSERIEKKLKKSGRFIYSASALFALLILSLVLFSFFSPNSAPGNGEKTVEFMIEPGKGAHTVSRNLEEAGVIQSASFFRILLRATGKGGSLKTGLYELNNGMSSLDVIRVLTEGRVRMTALTIPEGWNNVQIAEYLVDKGFAKNKEQFLSLTREKKTLNLFHINAESSEGYLFPDTYMVPDGYPLEKIHIAMLKHFFEKIKEADIPDGMTSEELHERLILASIIEREAAQPDELPVMASVFLNRINQKMRLESCATVQYILGKPHARLYEKDLKIKSPYNTYLKRGLPPGPISSPGLPALKAAFHPKNTSYLFFVLKPKEQRHHFSETYTEHLKAKKRYLGE